MVDIFSCCSSLSVLHSLLLKFSSNEHSSKIFPYEFIHCPHTLFSIHFLLRPYLSIAIHSDGSSIFLLKVCGNSRQASQLAPFSNSTCSLWVLVSHFGDYHNISNVFIIVYLLQWSSVLSDFYVLLGLNEGSEDG